MYVIRYTLYAIQYTQCLCKMGVYLCSTHSGTPCTFYDIHTIVIPAQLPKLCSKIANPIYSVLPCMPEVLPCMPELLPLYKHACDTSLSFTLTTPPADVYCKKILSIYKGQVAEPRDHYKSGDSLSFQCDEGYQLEGAKAIKCQAYGEWDSNPPVCKGRKIVL